MPMVRIFSGSYCGGEEVARGAANRLGWEYVDDAAIIAAAADGFRVSRDALARTLKGGVSAFNGFTHERERNTERLRFQVAELMGRDNVVLHGFASHLVPSGISHVLSVCVIADVAHRAAEAARRNGITEKEARRIIDADNEGSRLWTDYLLRKDPWDAAIYDILIPTNKVPVNGAVDLVCGHAAGGALGRTAASTRAVEDFSLAARVSIELGKSGHDVAVSASGGMVTLTINRHVLMLARLEEELRAIAGRVPGVKSVETKVGPGFYQGGVYRQFNPELPSRVLLVDDERDFVQTLSERLLMREVGLAVAHDGEEALSFVRAEEPDVMVLDLRMPGMDGIEVLKRVKSEHPGVEVIVLTGHGTKKDEETCMALGAFAYLEKPVDIEKLSAAMRAAHQRAMERNTDREGS